MITLGNNAHLFAQPHRESELLSCFELVAGPGAAASVAHPAFPRPLLIIRFPGGGSLSVEFVDEAPDADEPRLGTWLELRADDPEAVMRRLLEAGHREVVHPGHPHYFMAPGGQVFTVIASTGG